jgi:tetratricopeptide (TPR) repeat protein
MPTRFPIAAAALLTVFFAQTVAAQESAQLKRLERAAELINSDQLAAAEQQLRSVLRATPNQAVALNLLGTVRAKQGKLNEAETLFTRAVRADGRLTGARMNLARVHLLKRELPKTIVQLKEILLVEPENPEARYRLAWAFMAQGNFAECISFVEKIADPQLLSTSLLGLLAEAYLKQGDVNRAQDLYQQILNREGGNPDALLGLASAAHVRKETATAELYLNRAREAVGEAPDLLYKFALVALDLGLRDQAVSSLQRAIQHKHDSSYYFVLGSAWLKSPPDLLEAEAAFKEFVRLQPEHADGQLHFGYVLLKQKKYPAAREALEKSVKLNAESPEGFYYLGLIAQEHNENLRAVDLFGKAILLAPSFANARIALGATYLKLKDYSRAQKELEAGVKLSPDDSKAHYNLAILYTRLKQPERAQQEMRIVENLKASGKGQEAETEPGSAPLRPR